MNSMCFYCCPKIYLLYMYCVVLYLSNVQPPSLCMHSCCSKLFWIPSLYHTSTHASWQTHSMSINIFGGDFINNRLMLLENHTNPTPNPIWMLAANVLSLVFYISFFLCQHNRWARNFLSFPYSWDCRQKCNWNSWMADMASRIHWPLTTFTVIECGTTTTRSRPPHPSTHRPKTITNSRVACARKLSRCKDFWIDTWNVIRTLNDTCAPSAEKDSTTHSIWSVTRARTPAYAPTSAICAKNRSRSDAHWNRIVWKCMVYNTSTRTRSAAQR